MHPRMTSVWWSMMLIFFDIHQIYSWNQCHDSTILLNLVYYGGAFPNFRFPLQCYFVDGLERKEAISITSHMLMHIMSSTCATQNYPFLFIPTFWKHVVATVKSTVFNKNLRNKQIKRTHHVRSKLNFQVCATKLSCLQTNEAKCDFELL